MQLFPFPAHPMCVSTVANDTLEVLVKRSDTNTFWSVHWSCAALAWEKAEVMPRSSEKQTKLERRLALLAVVCSHRDLVVLHCCCRCPVHPGSCRERRLDQHRHGLRRDCPGIGPEGCMESYQHECAASQRTARRRRP